MDAKQAEARLKALSEELRCLVCQNQSLADSNAELAIDLRNQVKALIDKGMSDAQIKSYLVDRYGDFVLFKPPVQTNTWLLWFGPFVLLLLGGFIWRRVQRAGARSDTTSGASPSNDGLAARNDSQNIESLKAARKLLD